MPSAHILVVDDDALMSRSLSLSLQEAGYRASTALTAENGLSQAVTDPPDLVLLDIGLPGMDGLDALKHFQSRVNVPVIFLTARRREFDEVLGLELGAEDYITKPFDLDVLLARIKTVLRRVDHGKVPPIQVSPGPLVLGDMVIDPSSHTVTVGGRPVELTPLEFDLLHTLALQPGHVFSVDDLLTRVWGAEYIGQPQVVYVHVHWLRDRLEEDPHNPRRIVTVRGVGYKLEPFTPQP
jgi:DNA-binding response OmpR family regulator